MAALDLGSQPLADTFPLPDEPDPPFGPLALGVCPACALVQATTPLPSGRDSGHIWPESRPEGSGSVLSAALRAHIAGLGDAVRARGLGEVVASGHHSAAFRRDDRSMLRSSRPKAVVDHAGLAHEDDLRGAVARLAGMVADGDWLVVEFHHALALLERGQFDVITHEHRSYLTCTALRPLLAEHGLTVTDAERITIYDGSLRLWARRGGEPSAPNESVAAIEADEAAVSEPAPWHALGHDARAAARAFRAFLEQEPSVAGYGAPSRASTLLHLANVGADLLPFTVDASPAKQGRRLPGTNIAIEHPDALAAANPAVVVVLPYDLAAEIVAQQRHALRARYVVALPELREVD